MWHTCRSWAGCTIRTRENLLRRKEGVGERRVGTPSARGNAGSPRLLRRGRPRVATSAAAPSAVAAPAGAGRSPMRPNRRRAARPWPTSARRINGKMFSYNANKQAYIADITAGTTRNCRGRRELSGVHHPSIPASRANPNDRIGALLERAAALCVGPLERAVTEA